MTNNTDYNDSGILVSEEILKLIEDKLPDFFTRKTAAEALQGLFTEKTLANLEVRHIGPEVHYMGRRALYVKEEFMTWLREYYGGMHEEYHGFSRIVYRSKDPAAGTGSKSE